MKLTLCIMLLVGMLGIGYTLGTERQRIIDNTISNAMVLSDEMITLHGDVKMLQVAIESYDGKQILISRPRNFSILSVLSDQNSLTTEVNNANIHMEVTPYGDRLMGTTTFSGIRAEAGDLQ